MPSRCFKHLSSARNNCIMLRYHTRPKPRAPAAQTWRTDQHHVVEFSLIGYKYIRVPSFSEQP